MQSHQHNPHISCYRKIKYKTPETAEMMADHYNQVAYHCLYCNQYHLTRKERACYVCTLPAPPNMSSYRVGEKGRLYSLTKNKWLKQTPRKINGYKYTTLKDDNGTEKQYAIHRVVAQTYHPNPDDKPYVNHKDFNRANNHVNNLEWVTAKENSEHYFINR